MTFLDFAAFAGLCALGLATGAVAWRLIHGPSTADRVIATDMLGLLAICLAALIAVIAGARAYLDVAFGIALIGFLAAVSFGALLERASLRRSAGE
ncbi:MAG: monovalent cation/H+ antiporter complex subunit F [Tagaea sp.]|nr:monovalent cation/H+ antiporter complex subunit F [Tagaea sp.]